MGVSLADFQSSVNLPWLIGWLKISHIRLTPSLPECLMEFCKVTVTFEAVDVTIHMKDLCLNFHTMLFVCKNFRK